MKFLIIFGVAALFGFVHCDKECFRSVFRQCVRDAVPMERMTLCDEIKNQIDCISDKAFECKMDFWEDALNLAAGVHGVCAIKHRFDLDKPCYLKAVTNSKCAQPINEAMKGLKTSEDFIRANKKICNLFEPFSDCVEEYVKVNCNKDKDFSVSNFIEIYRPYRGLSKSLCEQLVLPADEKDSRPDNFGMMNVYASLVAMFA